MREVLLLGLLGLPMVSGIWLYLPETGPPRRARWVVSLAAGAVALCALGLLPFAGQTPALILTWLPGTGPMALSLEANSLYALTATATAAVVVFMAAAPPDPGRREGALALLALSAGNLAFLSGHFLLRYVALEAVGLCIAAAALWGEAGKRRLSNAGAIYLLLRLGDAGLLVAILLLHAAVETLEIGPSLAAAQALAPLDQRWVVVGFLLAVAVKVGLWPFHTWVQGGARLSRSTYAWLYATLMPNLGLYLLYRVVPLAAASPALNRPALWAGAAACAMAALPALLQPRRTRLPAQLSAVAGGVVWCLALWSGAAVARWGLLALTLARLPLFLWLPGTTASGEQAPDWTVPGGVLSRLAQRVHTTVELGGLERGLAGGATGLRRAAGWLYTHVELGLLEGGLATLAGRAISGAAHLRMTVEQRGLEGLLQGIVRSVWQGGLRLRRWQTGHLQANLWWVVVCLLLAILVALSR